MNLFVESSAVLAWLLDEPSSDSVIGILGEAAVVLASELTLVECDRVLIRAAATGALPEAEAARRRARLGATAKHWHLLRIDEEALERSRRPFPHEPVRTLDSLHLASSLVAATAVPDLLLLSLDERVRSNAELLGFRVVPE